MKNAHKIVTGKHEVKRPLGRTWRKWEDKVRIYLGEIGRKGVDWIHLALDSDQWRTPVSAVMKHGVS
jgi:hypothetical protein